MEMEDEGESGESGYKQLVAKLMMLVKQLEKYEPESEMEDDESEMEDDSKSGLVIMLGPGRKRGR